MTLKDSKIDIKFSVIIPYYQQKAALVKCLGALSEQDYNGEIEILVVYHPSEEHIDQLKNDYPSIKWVINDQRPDIIHAHTFLGGWVCLLYTSPSPRDLSTSRMPSSA